MENKQISDPNDHINWNLGIIADIASITNGITGIIAIYVLLHSEFYLSVRLLGLGILLDALDGYLARKAKLPNSRKRGIYIDSISDGITFGLFPAGLCIALYDNTVLLVITTGIYLVATWYRLARYTQEADINRFSGLPSPAAAAVTASFLILFDPPVYFVALFLLTIAGLMASKIIYPSLKKPHGFVKHMHTMTGINASLFVVLPESIGIFFLAILFLISIVYIFIGSFWISSIDKSTDTSISK